ncbi:hypothetical protein GCM10028803_00280 [Larkinella knui]|uniref:Uncharacterized protein n=1 Tax=Larkinella knui TaxID=2025310 RepID=A0A3P1CJI8_9BACT|nr:hypothetical protein [Larkinella knui]RRB13435.1 hypothetical protein EHT87_14255 [Larkinella knui]
MELSELQELVGQWYGTGHISTENRERLKQEYFRITETTDTGRCTRCDSFWSDVQMILRIHLKQNQMPVMAKVRKYLIADNDTIVMRGTNIHYINEGDESEYVKVFTDAVAEKILKDNPSMLGKSIIENPEYVGPAKPATAKVTPPAKPAAAPRTSAARSTKPIVPPADSKTDDENKDTTATE